MPNKQITDGNYRYNFQGQEKDPETGMEAFELRLWDGRLGRWLTVDPMGEFDSPYLGMGNNPISLTDPDGGSTSGPGDPPIDPPVKGGVLSEITVTGISHHIKDVTSFMSVFVLNSVMQTANNNIAFGIVKMPSTSTFGKYELAAIGGRLASNVNSIVQGGIEDLFGGGMAIASDGALALPAAFVVAHGDGVVLAGVAGTGVEIGNLANYFAKNKHGSGGNGGGGGSPKTQFNKGKKAIENGEIKPHNTYKGRENPKWAGAEEYKVPGSPSGDKWRILKLVKNGKVTWGWTEDHYAKGSIHLFPGSSW